MKTKLKYTLLFGVQDFHLQIGKAKNNRKIKRHQSWKVNCIISRKIARKIFCGQPGEILSSPAFLETKQNWTFSVPVASGLKP